MLTFLPALRCLFCYGISSPYAHTRVRCRRHSVLRSKYLSDQHHRHARLVPVYSSIMRGGNGGPCCHCGATSSPCWRRGPPDKPILCNACGARYLAKNKQATALEGWIPGSRRGNQAHGFNAAARQTRLVFEQQPGGQAAPEPARDVGYSKRAWQHVRADSSGASSMSKDTTEDSAAEYSSKKARLLSCSVYEIDPHTASALRLLKTFETADGVVLTVIRRPRKQAKPQPCAVM